MHTNNTKTLLLGKFHNPDRVMDAVKDIQETGLPVFDVYSPFPIHNLDKLMGIKRTRLSVAAFFFGMTGLISALLMMAYMLAWDWPMDIGGKPFFPGPAAVPVAFELTVLFSAFGMVFAFFGVNKMFPGRQPTVMDPRVTDDVMVIAVDKDKIDNPSALEDLFKKHGAHEVSEKKVFDEFLDVASTNV